MTVDSLIDGILKKEGGYVDHPADRGGPTHYGITLATLQAWRGHDVTADDVRHMDISEARKIYVSQYYLKPGIDRLPAIIQPITIDMAVNHGAVRAIRLVQEVVSKMGRDVAIDGKIGMMTVAACAIACNVYGQDVVRQIVARRKAFYRQICEHDPSQKVFLSGWLKRADSFLT